MKGNANRKAPKADQIYVAIPRAVLHGGDNLIRPEFRGRRRLAASDAKKTRR
jgi:hypothetical protein